MLLRELKARETGLADLQQAGADLVHIPDANLSLQQSADCNILTEGGILQFLAKLLLPVSIMFNRVHADRFVRTTVVDQICLSITIEALSVQTNRPRRGQLVNPRLQRLAAIVHRYRLTYIKRNDFHPHSLQSAYST
ncbi:hypothetical protein D3C75_1036950 [compost metagenome]